MKFNRQEIMEFFRSFEEESILEFFKIDDLHEIALHCSAHNIELYNLVNQGFENG